MTDVAKKDRTLNLRVSTEDREELERAAQLDGLTLSALVLHAARDRARQVLRAHSSMVVPSEEFDRLLAALDEPAGELGRLGKAIDSLPTVVEQR